VYWGSSDPSWRFPFDDTDPAVNDWPYTVTGNGNVTAVVQSSQWFPTSVVPGTTGWPVCVVIV
jgi:hypothetical protein